MDAQRAKGKLQNMVLFSGTAVPGLADEVAYELDASMGGISLTRFADGEVGVQVLDHVRGKDVFLIQSTSQPVNENLMELLLTITTLRRSSAREITAVIPYYGARWRWARKGVREALEREAGQTSLGTRGCMSERHGNSPPLPSFPC